MGSAESVAGSAGEQGQAGREEKPAGAAGAVRGTGRPKSHGPTNVAVAAGDDPQVLQPGAAYTGRAA
jgi:hypothetical protein